MTQGGLGFLFPSSTNIERPGRLPEIDPISLPQPEFASEDEQPALDPNLRNILANPHQAAILRGGAGQEGQGTGILPSAGGAGGLGGAQPIGTGIEQKVQSFAEGNAAALAGGELQTLGSIFGVEELEFGQGIKDLIAGKEIKRQRQALPALNFRTPNISNFNRLSLREQSEFMALAQLSGLTPEEVQREILSVSPGAFGQQGTVGLRSR